jgi:type II secretory ATPase GspE/PulE/Tfp pilus assembly ATPase PilB-like protein
MSAVPATAPAAAPTPAKPRRLGDVLIERGILTPDQLRVAITEQKRSGETIGRILVRLGLVTEAVVRDAIGEVQRTDSIDLSKAVPDREALAQVPKDTARRFKVMPVSWNAAQRELSLAMPDTSNLVLLDQLRAALGGNLLLKPVLAAETEVLTAIDQFYGHELSIDGILHEIETGEVDYQSLAQAEEYSQPVVRLVDALLADAVKRGASDIHFEPEGGFLRVRYRIDGVLRPVRSLHSDYWAAMTVRLKVLSGMNIAETRAPQDGRFSLALGGRRIDFRASVQPVTHGENFVLRVLDKNRGLVPLDKLGLTPQALTTLKIMMARPEGILLVTGPTGSGKTTTLYSMLNHVSTPGVNIMTLEDPVEYPLPLLRQTSVNESVKLDFASGIRSMMRQDPDIILVGEVRDKETADMAMRAAMTGHQVFSTLHTNSALGAIPRLLDLGVLPDILAGNIIGIVAQRLVRTLCPHCKQSYAPAEFERRILGVTPDEGLTLYRARGCPACEETGYKGRMALLELLKLDAEMDDMIARREGLRALREHALQAGFQPLAADALRRVREGFTSIEEAARVVDLTANL